MVVVWGRGDGFGVKIYFGRLGGGVGCLGLEEGGYEGCCEWEVKLIGIGSLCELGKGRGGGGGKSGVGGIIMS